jgi:ABC-type dipeptide/oligopeptide/nickel transport system permease subunit
MTAPVTTPVSTPAAPIAPTDAVVPGNRSTFWSDARRRFFRNKVAVAALVVFIGLILFAIYGFLFFRSDYTSARSGLQRKSLFSEYGILGTDTLGRNILHRISRGLGISLSLAAAVTILSTAIGMLMGGISGYKGGWVDLVVGRVVDAVYAIPYVIIGISAVAVFGAKFQTVLLTLVFTGWLSTALLFRASVLQIRSQDYIEAARATGASTKRILLQHVLPNALPPIIISVAFGVASAIQVEAIFSFLGIGFIEPTPALGVMIRNARGQFTSYPHLLLVPATVLVLLTVSIALVGDGLRDALDPKLRGAD